MKNTVEIFTDGACSGNPGPGGWAALLRCRGQEKMISGGESNTTNNRMEMMAAIAALQALTKQSEVELTTDSKYVEQGIREWLPNWKARGWKTSAKADVRNRDLWEVLDALNQYHNVSWHWVRGHSGHAENERVDVAAREAIARL